jgi:hypothetical protein
MMERPDLKKDCRPNLFLPEFIYKKLGSDLNVLLETFKNNEVFMQNNSETVVLDLYQNILRQKLSLDDMITWLYIESMLESTLDNYGWIEELFGKDSNTLFYVLEKIVYGFQDISGEDVEKISITYINNIVSDIMLGKGHYALSTKVELPDSLCRVEPVNGGKVIVIGDELLKTIINNKKEDKELYVTIIAKMLVKYYNHIYKNENINKCFKLDKIYHFVIDFL